MLSYFNKIKKFFSLCLIVSIISILFSGCSFQSNTNSNNKIKVTASLFPQYDFAKQIAKDKAEVTLLLPPGTESHTFDPSPIDILNISNSDIFLYTGEEMEPWASKIINSIENNDLTICDVSSGIDLKKTIDNDEHDDHEHEEHHTHNYDPHIWLDPTLAVKMVDNITSSFCSKDPSNSEFYKNNAESYKNDLLNLDNKFKTMIDSSKRKSIVFAGRFAHLYFIERYGLKYISAFDSCSTESEPSVKKISDIVNFINKNHIPVIYYEEFSEPKIANSISEQTGTQSLKFSTLHNVTREQLENNSTYIDLMLENFENLRQGLN